MISETLFVFPIQFKQPILRRLDRFGKPKGFSLFFFSVVRARDREAAAFDIQEASNGDGLWPMAAAAAS